MCKGAAGKLLAPPLPPRPSKTSTVALKPRIARFWLSYWKLCRFPSHLARDGAKGMCGGKRGRSGKQDPSILNLLSLGVGGRRPFQLLFHSPVGGKKNRPNHGARLETNPPPREFVKGWSVDKRPEGSNLAQTKQSVTHKDLQICRGSPASPPCSSENALCSGQHCHADRHTHARPKKKKKKKTPANV